MADTSEIGIIAADLMERIERDHPNGTIGEVGIVVEVKYEGQYTIEARCTDNRPWVASSLFEAAMRAIRG